MPRVLLIDDEATYFKMVDRALKSTNYELIYANNGMDGLKLAAENIPDVIIVDIMLPDMLGFDVAQRLRQDSRFERTPIMFMTSQSDVNDKIKAFDIGADDYLIKPFQPEEFVARVNLLYKRSQMLRRALHTDTKQTAATIVALHNLRGGVGCSSLSVNLATSYYKLWERPTLLLDGVLMSGQIALMLNSSISHSWEDLVGIEQAEIDENVINAVINKHKSGIDFFPAPNHPIADDSIPAEAVQLTIDHLKQHYEFIVMDLAHDFSNFTISMLTAADRILLVIAPEMASIHSAVSTLQIYDKLGFEPDRVQIVINNTFPDQGIKQAHIEKVLKRPVKFVIPYVANEFIRSINYGIPLVANLPDSPTAELFEDIAYDLSSDKLKNIPPASATNAWKRITNRSQKKKIQLW
jgi:pilus assembly protein CpaE